MWGNSIQQSGKCSEVKTTVASLSFSFESVQELERLDVEKSETSFTDTIRHLPVGIMV